VCLFWSIYLSSRQSFFSLHIFLTRLSLAFILSLTHTAMCHCWGRLLHLSVARQFLLLLRRVPRQRHGFLGRDPQIIRKLEKR